MHHVRHGMVTYLHGGPYDPYGQIDEQKRLDRKPPWVNLGEFNTCEGTCMLGKSFKVWGMGAL